MGILAPLLLCILYFHSVCGNQAEHFTAFQDKVLLVFICFKNKNKNMVGMLYLDVRTSNCQALGPSVDLLYLWLDCIQHMITV